MLAVNLFLINIVTLDIICFECVMFKGGKILVSLVQKKIKFLYKILLGVLLFMSDTVILNVCFD